VLAFADNVPGITGNTLIAACAGVVTAVFVGGYSRGYPAPAVVINGTLAGLVAITAVADVFDALTSVRVYKKAFTVEVARSMIEQEAGTHFDPAIIEAFTARFDELAQVRRETDAKTGHREAA